tara:strand:- start:6792 stop:9524 length:2733 start_codon:yes stop_codon:yes gene_type:complete
MKRLFTLAITFLTGLSLHLYAQTPTHQWVNSSGGNQADQVYDIVVDSLGNSYTLGTFQATAYFNTGATTVRSFTSNGSHDIFIQKRDAQGIAQWVKQIGGAGADIGFGLALDASKNIYIAGQFRNTVDFDPGTGTQNRSSTALDDAFLLKLDSNGTFVWVQTLGRSGRSYNIRLKDVAVDRNGDILTIGEFSGSFDMNPGSGSNFTVYNSPGNNFWLQKWNASGNYIWGRYGQGSTTNKCIAIDGNNNIYFGGSHSGGVDFRWGPGFGQVNSSNGGVDAYLTKYNSSGNYVYDYTWGDLGNDEVSDISIDANNNVIVAGTYANGPDFNPGVVFTQIPAVGSTDAYVSKFNPSGTYQWTKTFGSSSADAGNAVSTDNQGNIYTVGYYGGTIDFDPGTANTNTSWSGFSDAYIHKMDASGNFQWVATLSSPADEESFAIASDVNGGILHAGLFNALNPNPLDFDFGSGTSNLQSLGNDDVFVQKIKECITATSTDVQTACGSFTWIDGITYTSSNNTATFTYAGASATGCDSIVTLNLSLSPIASGVDVQTACNSFTWIDGNTYTASTNSVSHTLVGAAANGCDSIVTLNLTLGNSSLDTLSIQSCGAYTWAFNGQSYSSTGFYLDTVITAAGCDSILALDLNVSQTYLSIDTVKHCGNVYLWQVGGSSQALTTSGLYYDTLSTLAGCDSILGLDLDINQNSSVAFSRRACKEFISPSGKVVRTSGLLRDTLPNAAGCDSIMQINVTIDTLDTRVSRNGNTLTSLNNARPGPAHQWVDCNNNYAPLIGETGNSFTPSMNGSYALILSDPNNAVCADTSACFSFTSVGLADNYSLQGIRVYPNPNTNGILHIEVPTSEQQLIYRLRNALGQLLMEGSISTTNTQIEWHGETGIYYLEMMNSKGEKSIQKVVKR